MNLKSGGLVSQFREVITACRGILEEGVKMAVEEADEQSIKDGGRACDGAI